MYGLEDARLYHNQQSLYAQQMEQENRRAEDESKNGRTEDES